MPYPGWNFFNWRSKHSNWERIYLQQGHLLSFNVEFLLVNSTTKLENIQKKTLRFVIHDAESDYDTLMIKFNKYTMEVGKQKSIALEVFWWINNLNPSYLQNMFTKKNDTRTYKNYLQVSARNIVIFGGKSIKVLGPHIWERLPKTLKFDSSFQVFKHFLND